MTQHCSLWKRQGRTILAPKDILLATEAAKELTNDRSDYGVCVLHFFDTSTLDNAVPCGWSKTNQFSASMWTIDELGHLGAHVTSQSRHVFEATFAPWKVMLGP